MKKMLVLCAFVAVAYNSWAQNWQLLGNAGTTNANFVGTTDNRPLLFRTNNQLSGRIDPPGANNTFFGYQSGATITTGSNNSAIGQYALFANTTGRSNTAAGVNALRYNTTGVDNTAAGYQAMQINISGNYNAAFGVNALFANATGHNNTALGNLALYRNNSGVNNTAVGQAALYSNETGRSNVAVGFRSLYSNVRGNNLVAIGDSALYRNTTGIYNTAVGSKAGYNNDEGQTNSYLGYQAGYSNNDGKSNTAVGYQALYFNFGDANAAVGSYALYNNHSSANVAFGPHTSYDNTSGLANTSIGQQALRQNTTGSFNTAAGSNAGKGFNGDNNTFIGNETDATADGYDHSTALGAFAKITASDQVRIGIASTTSIGGFANWSNISDGRFKKNIQQNVPGLDFILQLQPVTYNLDITGLNNFLQLNNSSTLANGTVVPIAHRAGQKETAVISGFVAQEVEVLAKKLNYSFSGIDAPKNEKDLYALRYAEFVVPLVKAMQEQQKIIEALQHQLQEVRVKLGLETIITKAKHN